MCIYLILLGCDSWRSFLLLTTRSKFVVVVVTSVVGVYIAVQTRDWCERVHTGLNQRLCQVKLISR